jgi:hypothetical protein
MLKIKNISITGLLETQSEIENYQDKEQDDMIVGNEYKRYF